MLTANSHCDQLEADRVMKFGRTPLEAMRRLPGLELTMRALAPSGRQFNALSRCIDNDGKSTL